MTGRAKDRYADCERTADPLPNPWRFVLYAVALFAFVMFAWWLAGKVCGL